MSATVNLGDGTALTFDALPPSHRVPEKRVLLSIEGRHGGETLNCALIPLHRIGVVIASLQLVAKQLQGDGVRCHGDACAAGQHPCPTPEICGVKPA